MAFENINVGSLKSALNSCKNSINNNISKELKNNVINSDIWHCNARNNLRGSLGKLEGLYNDLNSKIDHYLSLANEIEKYQNLVTTNNDLRNQYNDLNNRLYRKEKYDRWYCDEETGEWKSVPDTRKVKDVNVENQMNNIKNQIENNESSMQSISNKVANAL